MDGQQTEQWRAGWTACRLALAERILDARSLVPRDSLASIVTAALGEITREMEPSGTPAREQDSREAWRRLYHEARGVADRMQAENTRLRAELDQARADLAEAENRAPTGLEERGA